MSATLIRNGDFLKLWLGTTASGLATWALPFVLALAVVNDGLSATALGVVLAARTVGFLIAVPVGGIAADRYSRRRVVLWASLAAALGHPLMAFGLGRSVALMACAAALAGAGQGACRPSYQALTAEVVEQGHRQQANAAITIAVRVTTLVSPALTAMAATVAGIPALLWIVGGLWLISAFLPPDRPKTPSGHGDDRAAFATDFMDGIREARRHPWFLAGLAALTAVIFTGYSVTGVALPLVSRDRYGGEAVLAAATTAYVAGALIGALVVSRWRPDSQGWAALAGLALYGFAPLSLLLPLPAVLVIAAYAVTGLGIELFNVPWFTATQREVEPAKLARVSSLDFLLSYGLAPLGLVAIAPAMQHFGATTVLALCTMVCFLAPLLAASVPTTRRFSG